MNVNARQFLNREVPDVSPLHLPVLKSEPAHVGCYQANFHSRSLASIRGCATTHPHSRWIEKSESPFNWEERAAGGELVTRMWVSDQKLANGVEIAAELWSLIGQQPDATMMIVVDDDHAPCALTGQELLELKDSRQITLHPARYRIVENHS
jgi:hypothetical protein